MKEILFRGKTERGNWVYGSLIVSGKYCCILGADDGSCYDYPYLDSEIGTIDGCATPVIPETVGRLIEYPCYDSYRENERIFEGDILKVRGKHWREGEILDYDTAIAVDESSISVDGKGIRFPQDTIRVKVIGNVHDNPELVGRKYADLYKYYRGFRLKDLEIKED